MNHGGIVRENQLDEWVRGHSEVAKGVIVELVWRLVAAACPRPKERRFPLGDSIGQPGPDGVLDTDFGFAPFVPEGRSLWEIGTGVKAGDKATSDYRDLTKDTPEETRRKSTFVFVTPLSGRRDWQYTWREDAQGAWLEDRRNRHDWRDVCVIDGSGLVDWLQQFPAVEQWLAASMGLPADEIQSAEQRWDELRTIGEPPPLSPDVFLIGREKARGQVEELFAEKTVQVRLDTHFPDDVVPFACACIAHMDAESRVDVAGRSLVISSAKAWDAITALRQRHILVADFDLDECDTTGARLLEKARRSRHAVVYGGMPGGIPHPNRVSIPGPKGYQIRDALQKAGYNEERARILGQKAAGNLGALLRCLQNLSVMPEWAQQTDAAELAIAELLGSWQEGVDGDKTIAERLSKKAYGEWIGQIREFALRPGTPLSHRDGKWKVIARYEGWYALGPKLFDDHLGRFHECVVAVLSEPNPMFELPAGERYMANVRGKVLKHSNSLRDGLAESLALLGSQPKALRSCSRGKPQTIAALTVRKVLADADSILWGSLNHVLPLLAEAAPGEFLDAVEKALKSDPCPFDALFAEESTGIFGANYMTGLLWALETLAWDAELLTRVAVILGELAARDPGGNWGNRPANSLSTILLPWLPQTCATTAKRRTAVETLAFEFPRIAWELLLAFLPGSQQMSSGSRKPVWREIIPTDWKDGVTSAEYWEQIRIYVELITSIARTDLSKLGELIDHLDDLPKDVRDQVLVHLESEQIVSLPEDQRLLLWTELLGVVVKHKKFADAEWAMESEEVERIARVTDQLKPLAPELRYRRLFSNRGLELFEEKGNYREQEKKLLQRRKDGVKEVYTSGGMPLILDFARVVESPMHLGIALGRIDGEEVDRAILPELLDIKEKPLSEFAGGFVWGRFHASGWQWVDALDVSQWSLAQIGQFLACLPFEPETWKRTSDLLGQDESPYWVRAAVNPYGVESSVESAVDRLLEHGRPYAAIRCLAAMCHQEQPLNSKQAVRALMSTHDSSEDPHATDAYDFREVIKALQESEDTDPEDLFQVEWAYLPFLDHDQGSRPRLLEQRLADEPAFFCEAIRIVYRSKKEEEPEKEATQNQKDIGSNVYRLLHGWRRPPGIQEDGTFDGGALLAWLDAVKQTCADSGHLEVALLTVGHVFAYMPADPDGLWIHHAAAEVLNAPDADDMRDGFTTQLYNLRGVHGFTAGQQEKKIAQKYRGQADEVEAQGYHRFATALRRLAAQYDREAEREEMRDPFE